MIFQFLNRYTILAMGISSLLFIPHTANANTAQYNDLLNAALTQDIWQAQSQQQVRALHAQSKAVPSLPDPRVDFRILSVPTDTLALDQENMTQLQLGVTQMLPRGNTISIKQQQLIAQAKTLTVDQQLRKRQVAQQFTLDWITAVGADWQLTVLNNQQEVLQQFIAAVENDYATTTQRTSQYGVVSAQLLLTTLHDQIDTIENQRNTALKKLTRWLMRYDANNSSRDTQSIEITEQDHVWLTQYKNNAAGLIDTLDNRATEQMYAHLAAHPAILRFAQQRELSMINESNIAQQFEPQWGLSASYGYRMDGNNNNQRADLLSVGVSVDIPVFSRAARQPDLDVAKASTAEIETNRRLQLKQIVSEVTSLYETWQSLASRLTRFKTTILPMREEAQSTALNAYTHDSGRLTDVLESKIAAIRTQIDIISLTTQMAKTATQIDYYWANQQPAFNQQAVKE